MDLPDFARARFREPERSRVRLEDIAWSPDGLLLAGVGEETNLFRFWDIDGAYSSHRFSTKVDPRGLLTALAWSPDGLRLAVGGDGPGLNHLLSLEDGTRTPLEGCCTITRLAWCPTGKSLASGVDEGTLLICQPERGFSTYRLPDVPSGPVCGLAWFAPDLLVSMTEDSLQPRCWSLHGAPSIDAMPVGTAPNCVIAHPDGTGLTAGGIGGDLLIWDAFRPTDHAHWPSAHPGPVRALSWRRDAGVLASACDRQLAFWNRRAHEPLHVFPLEGRGHRLAWHPGGEVLAIALREPDALVLLDFRTREIDPRYADGEPPDD